MSVLRWIGNPWDVPVGLTLMRDGQIGMVFIPKEFCSQRDRFEHADLLRRLSGTSARTDPYLVSMFNGDTL